MTIHQIPNTASLEAFWMPFTANRQFKAEPRLIASAEGMHYTSVDGRKLIDGFGRIVVRQRRPRPARDRRCGCSGSSRRWTIAPSFQIGPSAGVRFRREAGGDRARRAGPHLLHQFRLGIGRHRAQDRAGLSSRRRPGDAHPPDRPRARLSWRRFRRHVGRRHGQQPQGLRDASAGRRPSGHTHDLARNAFSKGQPEHGAELADDLERLVALHGAETIAAVIVEPVAGSTGVCSPPQGYLQRLRALCDKHGILLIFDEVITGFGRLGTPFAANYFGVTPDMITTAKGITNGAIPMGAVFASRKIHDALMTGPAQPDRAVPRLYLFGASGGLRRRPRHAGHLPGRGPADARRRAGRLLAGCPAFAEGLPNVIDIRNLGLVAARRTLVPHGCGGRARL